MYSENVLCLATQIHVFKNEWYKMSNKGLTGLLDISPCTLHLTIFVPMEFPIKFDMVRVTCYNF